MFRSAELWHEVLPTGPTRDRYALTAWLYARSPSAPAAAPSADDGASPLPLAAEAGSGAGVSEGAAASSSSARGAASSSNEAGCPNSEDRIFVSIVSYRDPECQHTIADLFDKAQRPGRVYVGVCWQYHATEDRHCFVVPPSYPAQVRPCVVLVVGSVAGRDACGCGARVWLVVARRVALATTMAAAQCVRTRMAWCVSQVRMLRYPSTAAQGPAWARCQAQRLYRGEEYVLQIDSHSRFAPGWDTSLLRMLRACPSPKPVLTTYPPGYHLPNVVSPQQGLTLPPPPTLPIARPSSHPGLPAAAA